MDVWSMATMEEFARKHVGKWLVAAPGTHSKDRWRVVELLGYASGTLLYNVPPPTERDPRAVYGAVLEVVPNDMVAGSASLTEEYAAQLTAAAPGMYLALKECVRTGQMNIEAVQKALERAETPKRLQ